MGSTVLGLGETSTVLGAFVTSVLAYIVTDWAKQRGKKSNVLRVVGYIYRPLYYYLHIRAITLTTYMLSLASLFFIILSSSLLSVGASPFSILFSFAMISIFLSMGVGLLNKRKEIFSKLVDEAQSSIPDVDSLKRKWGRVHAELYGLAVRYFLIVLGITAAVTVALILADPEFHHVGALILASLAASAVAALVFHKIINGKLSSILDTETEFEERLFDLIKEPAFCVCVVDSSGNKYCGNLEGISYGISIKRDDGTVVNLPYDLIARAEGCPKSRNTSSTPQPFQ